MKKKLEKHAVDIATSCDPKSFDGIYQYTSDGDFYITDTYRVLQTETDVEGLTLNAHANKTIQLLKKPFDTVNDRDADYVRYSLPDVEELKSQLKELVGRKMTKVVWSDGKICINVRYLIKAMEALNSKYAFVSNKSSAYPILLCEDDDPMSLNRELIFGIYNRDGRKGMWIAEE